MVTIYWFLLEYLVCLLKTEKLRLQSMKMGKFRNLITGTESQNDESPFHFLVPIHCPLSEYLTCLPRIEKFATSVKERRSTKKKHVLKKWTFFKNRWFKSMISEIVDLNKRFLKSLIKSSIVDRAVSLQSFSHESLNFNNCEDLVYQNSIEYLGYLLTQHILHIK